VPLGASGCGGSGTVSGTVSYAGKPLKGGNVIFVGSEGKRSISGSIQEDGSYTLAKVPPGPVTVCVETESLNPGAKALARHYTPPPGMQAPAGLDEGNASTAKLYVKIPEKYSKPDQSGLSYTVKSGSQKYDIDLPR
jgi:hypothetical protein